MLQELALEILTEGIIGSIISIGRIALIMVPVLVSIELARYFKLLEKVAQKTGPMLRFLTLPPEAAFPLLAGFIFGIVYGAALIIDFAREGSLQKRDLILIGIFLSISHAVVEDTLILAAVGANAVILVGFRFFLAVLVTRLAAAYLDRAAVNKLLKEKESA